MSEIKLKPCPFCGGKASIHKWKYADDYDVTCESCGVMVDKNYMSEAEAAEAWNTRAERHGYWKQATPFVDTIECSECGYQWPEPDFASPYCPDCGARMDEVS